MIWGQPLDFYYLNMVPMLNLKGSRDQKIGQASCLTAISPEARRLGYFL